MGSSRPSGDGHVVLVGMMGSGKTTVGRALAAALGRPFVDLDDRVVAAAGRPVADVFAAEGEDAFRRWEAKALAEMLADPDPAVVATGGGVVTRPENADRLRAAGATVVWLRAEPGTLAARVGDGAGRPLLAGDDAGAAVRRLAAERARLYEAVAGVVVDVDGCTPSEVVERVAEALA